MSATLLVINAGSSSLKFHLYEVADEPRFLAGGQISGVATDRAKIVIRDAAGSVLHECRWAATQMANLASAQTQLMSWLDEYLDAPPAAVGHRIVHGGARWSASTVVDENVLAELAALIPLAPLHQRNNLTPVELLMQRWPDTLQVACFDTAFHRTLEAPRDRFALPRRYYEAGVRRYGFHGLSYEYIAGRLRELKPALASGRVVAAHLGSGASACAMVDGRSVETTMSFTALDGLPMGTRPGNLDPGVVMWMLEQGMTHAEIQQVLYHESGLRGISGLSGDMRELLASGDTDAQLAVDYFTYHAARQMAALGVASKGLDGLVFTAGIGETSAIVRANICAQLDWLGVELDPALNEQGATTISTASSAVQVMVVPTNEELVIARQTRSHL